jgi:hypothetical protein
VAKRPSEASPFRDRSPKPLAFRWGLFAVIDQQA